MPIRLRMVWPMLALLIWLLASPRTPPPTNPSRCSGVLVKPTANLSTVMASHRAGTTFCLTPGTFRVTSTIKTDVGDRVIGSGRTATHIDGTGLLQTAVGIFITNSNNFFAFFDIFGAPTPEAYGVRCPGYPSDCGKAFSTNGSGFTVQSVNCHDNGGNCIGGGGSTSVTVNDLNCYSNGSAYSRTSTFEYAACIKRVAAEGPGNNLTVTNSYIHDNYWVGIWCDYCKHGLFDIENNIIVNNGEAGVKWEMSGGWTTDDRAIIKNNVFRGNNRRETQPWSGAVNISTANDVLIEGNMFSQNFVAGINVVYTGGRGSPQPDSRGVVIQNNLSDVDPTEGCSLAGVTCE